MKHNWEMKKLEEVCKIKHGFAFDGKDFKSNVDENKPIVLTPGNFLENGNLYFNDKNTKRCLTNYPEDYKFDIGDLVVVMTDLSSKMKILGKPAFIENKNILHNQRIGRFIFKNNSIDKKYLFYFLLTSYYLNIIKETATGTMVRHTAPNRILNCKIPLPPLPEQKRIVVILDEAFTSITKTKENAEKNLANAKELFESYLNDIFTNLDDDWEKKKLNEVCDFVRGPFGGSLKKQIFVKNGFAVYEQSHAIYNQFNNIRYFINEEKFKEMKRFEINPGNLIMSCSGTMGKISIVPTEVKKGIINQALLLLKPSKRINNKFLKFWLESNSFQESLKAFSLGAAIQNVASVKTLKEIKIKFPKLSEQKSIVTKLDELSAETKHLEEIYKQKIASLVELKQSILNKAFNGEL